MGWQSQTVTNIRHTTILVPLSTWIHGDLKRSLGLLRVVARYSGSCYFPRSMKIIDPEYRLYVSYPLVKDIDNRRFMDGS
jgi:hypothetical protein